MADETETEPQEATGGGGVSVVIVILVMVLALAAGAGGAYFMLGSQSDAPTEVAEEEPTEPVDPGAEFQSRLVSIEPFVVNVSGEGYPRFLKIKFDLEADSEATKLELEARIPQVRDTTLLLLASKRLPEVSEFEGRALLKDDLRNRINDILGTGTVSSVLFTEFVVQ